MTIMTPNNNSNSLELHNISMVQPCQLAQLRFRRHISAKLHGHQLATLQFAAENLTLITLVHVDQFGDVSEVGRLKIVRQWVVNDLTDNSTRLTVVRATASSSCCILVDDDTTRKTNSQRMHTACPHLREEAAGRFWWSNHNTGRWWWLVGGVEQTQAVLGTPLLH